MPGKHITDQQKRLYMSERQLHSQVIAAAKSGISELSGRRIDKSQHQPSSSIPREYRTRPDPLDAIWASIVVPLLESCPSITVVGVFDHLCEVRPDSFNPKSRRTLERRVKEWRHLYGQNQPVIFRQLKEYGQLGIADFTFADFDITINQVPLKHRLFNYRLPASGWSFAQVVYGGESFSALVTGLQRAFRASGGVPNELRTDSLSAAYNNSGSQAIFAEQFSGFIDHYQLKASRNNRGIAHENGAIESPNNHLKNQLRQALLVRGSHDFATTTEYEIFVADIVERRNRRIKHLLVEEQRQLQALPAFDSVNYTEHRIKVRTTSAFQLKRVSYSVPSRLIGCMVNVRLFDDHLDVFVGGKLSLTLTRVHTTRVKQAQLIDYRHLIEALMKKPRAFRTYQWREQLLPSEDYRLIWQYVDKHLTADEASYYLVKLLHLAHKSDQEGALGRFVLAGIDTGILPTIIDCETRYLTDEKWVMTPHVQQHPLSSYQAILDEVKCHAS